MLAAGGMGSEATMNEDLSDRDSDSDYKSHCRLLTLNSGDGSRANRRACHN